MNPKSLKEIAADAFLADCAKLGIGLSRRHMFWVTIACSAVGWMFMNTAMFGFGMGVYGGLMMLAGVVASILMFEPEEK